MPDAGTCPQNLAALQEASHGAAASDRVGAMTWTADQLAAAADCTFWCPDLQWRRHVCVHNGCAGCGADVASVLSLEHTPQLLVDALHLY